MRFFYSILILLFSTFTTIGQTIQGKISDSSSGEPLIGVNILTGKNSGTASDIDGNYRIKTTSGKQTILFKFIGYKEVKKEVILQSGEVYILNVELHDAVMELGTVVVSAGKFEQKIEETTVSMEVIKPSLIENKNTTNIQTAMEQVPGVTITDGQANIRGGSGWSYGAGTRVQVMVDDMPLISGDAGQAQWSLISTENINQIEVIKGASSALYGSSALNGVINIRTAYPGSEPETKINFHHGFYDDAKRESLNWWGSRNQRVYGLDFLHKRKVDNLDLVVGGFLLEDEGYRFDETTSRKRINFNTRYKNKKIDGLSYGVNANFLFNTTASALIWQSYDQGFIPMDSAVTVTSGDVYNLDPYITYINSRNNDKHSLRTRYMKVVNDNSVKGEDNGQDNKSETYFTEYQYQKSIEGWRLNWTSGIMNEVVDAKAKLFNGRNYRVNTAFFSQLDKKFGKRLNLSAGARYEQFSLQSKSGIIVDGDSLKFFTEGKPVFRAGANYQLAEATYLRSSWGQGYRFPSIAELFISTNVGDIHVYANPNLSSEEGWSSEIAFRQGLKFGGWKGYVDIAAFMMRYQDMMEFSFGPWGTEGQDGIANLGLGFKSINIGETQVSGIEFSIAGTGKLVNNTDINILAGYLYTNPIALDPLHVYADSLYLGNYYEASSNNYDYTAEVANSENYPLMDMPEDYRQILKYRHKHQAKLDLELTNGKISSGVSMRYNSFMENIDAIFTSTLFEFAIPGIGINESREVLSDGDFIVDYRYSRKITKHSKISFIINNILNTEYQSRPANMMPPRTFSVQWSVKV